MDKRIRAKKDYHSFLSLIFKEILQQIPNEDADKLMNGYKAGKTIRFQIGQNSRGRFYKSAFQSSVSEDQTWRGLPETDGMAN